MWRTYSAAPGLLTGWGIGEQAARHHEAPRVRSADLEGDRPGEHGDARPHGRAEQRRNLPASRLRVSERRPRRNDAPTAARGVQPRAWCRARAVLTLKSVPLTSV